MLVTQSCMTLCNQWPTGLLCPWNSPGKNTGVGDIPSPGDFPNPGIKPRSSALQVDSLQSEPLWKPSDKFNYR